MENPKYKLVLVDDHVVMRNGLKELLEIVGPFSIVGEFDNGKRLIESYSEVSKIS